MAREVYGSAARSSLVMAQFIYGEKLTDNLAYYEHGHDGDVDDHAWSDDINTSDDDIYDDAIDDDDDKNSLVMAQFIYGEKLTDNLA